MQTRYPNKKLGSQTFIWLKNQIVSGAWPVNSRIPTESELMQTLNVGRGTIRESLRSLSSMGMIKSTAGIGTFVQASFPSDSLFIDLFRNQSSEDILGLRRALETFAAEEVAKNRSAEDLEKLETIIESNRRAIAEEQNSLRTAHGHSPGQFHSKIIEQTRNETVIAVYSAVMNVVRIRLASGLVKAGLDHEGHKDQHLALLDAIRRQDFESARKIANDHAGLDIIVIDTDADTDAEA